MAELATRVPSAAVIQSYVGIERELLHLLDEGGIPSRRTMTAREMAQAAETYGWIAPETRQAIEGMAILRNLAAHARADDLSPARALEYVMLAEAVLYGLRSARERAARDIAALEASLTPAEPGFTGERSVTET